MARRTFPLVDSLIGVPSTGQRYGAAALTPHGVVVELFADEACTTVLDATDVDGVTPITSVTVDGVTIPPFLGPPDDTTVVYGRAVGAVDSFRMTAIDTIIPDRLAESALDDRYALRSGRALVLTDPTFGAVGDGVTDDTAAVNAFLSELATNGGHGIIPAGSYRVTSTITITANPKPFTVTGVGQDVSTIVSDKPVAANAVAFVQAVGIRFAHFTIDGVAAATTNHGISAANATDCTIEDVTVRRHGYSAVMFYKNTGIAGSSTRNRIVRCTSRSEGAGRNGFLLESSTASSMIDCRVLDGIVASPGYGLQIKHAGENCEISGGYVENAVAGVAFGNEDPTLIAKGNRISGVVARNCTYGFIAGYAESNDVELTVRMESNAANQNAVRIAQGAKHNRVRAKITNPAAGVSLAYVKESGNLVELDTNVLGTANVAEFETGSDQNDVLLLQAGDKTAFGLMSAGVVNRGGAGNRVGLAAHGRELHAVPGVSTSTQRFTTAGGGNAAWIQYSHTGKWFVFRVDGSDRFLVDTAAAMPATDLAISLGKSTARYTEVHTKDGLILSSPNGTKYRIRVSDAGAVSAIAYP